MRRQSTRSASAAQYWRTRQPDGFAPHFSPILEMDENKHGQSYRLGSSAVSILFRSAVPSGWAALNTQDELRGAPSAALAPSDGSASRIIGGATGWRASQRASARQGQQRRANAMTSRGK